MEQEAQASEGSPLPRSRGVMGPRPHPSTPASAAALPATPTGGKRPAGEALSASPVIRKKIIGGLATRLGMSTEALDQAVAEAEVDAVSGEKWADVMEAEEEEERSRASGEEDDSEISSPTGTRPTSRTSQHGSRKDADVEMEGQAQEQEAWQLAQARSKRRQSARIAAAASNAAADAVAAAAASKAAQAAAAATAAARTQASVSGATGVHGDDAGSAPGEKDAIESARRSIADAEDSQRKAALERTKAYAGLFAHLEKMRADGHVDASDLEALLATVKACHRRGEANGYAPPFPRPVIQVFSEYAPKDPMRSLQLSQPRPPQGHQQHAQTQRQQQPQHTPASGLYSAAALRNGPPHPQPPTGPFAHLRDRRIVGQGHGSAMAAALQGGRSTDRLIARMDQSASARTKDPIELVLTINEVLCAAKALPHVRVDVVSLCPSGLTMLPRRGCSVQQLSAYKEAISISLGASAVDDNEQWERWVLHGVPTHAGSGQIDEEYLRRELDENLGGARRGEVKRMCKQEEDWSKKEATPVAFFTTARANLTEGSMIRMLGRIFWLRRYRVRPDSIMCGSCGTYRHKTADCRAEQRCRRCAQHGHKEETHEAHCDRCKSGKECVPLCMHCRGPHVAGDKACRNRPTWDRYAKAYTLAGGAQLNRITALGDRSRNKSIRAAQGPASGANAAELGARPGSDAASRL